MSDSLQLRIKIIINKLNLVSREEFEVQKKIIERLQKKINNLQNKKKTTRAKK